MSYELNQATMIISNTKSNKIMEYQSKLAIDCGLVKDGERRYESLTDEWKAILYIDVIKSTNMFDNLVTVLNHKFSWHYGDYRVQLFIDFLSSIWHSDPALRLKLFTDYNASLIYRDFRYPPLDVIEDFIERKFNTEVEKND